MKWTRVCRSISFKLVVFFLFFSLALNIFLLINVSYSIDLVHDQVTLSNQNYVHMYTRQIDQILEEADKFLLTSVLGTSDFYFLSLPREEDVNRYEFAKIQLDAGMSARLSQYEQITYYFLYSQRNDDLMLHQNSKILENTYNERLRVSDALRELLPGFGRNKGSYGQEWQVLRSFESVFLFRTISVDEVYIGAMIDMNSLLRFVNPEDSDVRPFFVSDEGEPLTNQAFVAEKGLSLENTFNGDVLPGTDDRYIVIDERSRHGKFHIAALIAEKQVLRRLPLIRRIVYILPIALLLIALAYVVFLTRCVVLPINRLVSALKQLREGNLDARIPQYKTSREFAIMNDAFNQMAGQIQGLKISIYEEQISKQRLELSRLHLQVNPHFFLNSLNVLYHLAGIKSFALIQEMCLCLVEYFRFMFRTDDPLVALKDELHLVRNYLRIQELRFPGFLSYTIEAPEALSDYPVPTLSIHTFVENAVKYAVTLDKLISILVRVELVNGRSDLRICVMDNGSGFPPDVLERLRQNESGICDTGERVGIYNIRRRLDILYGKSASITFSNASDGGACIIMLLPAQTAKA